MTKKKLIITITSLCLVVVAAVAAVVGVIAANNVAFNSKITVTYNPSAHVQATVAANYAENGGETQTLFAPANVAYGQAQASYEIPDQAITLTDEKPYVIFEFSFKNNVVKDQTAHNMLGVTITKNDDKTGEMTISEIKTTTKLATLDKTAFTAAKASSSETALDSLAPAENAESEGQTGYYYVMVEIVPGKAGSWGTKGGATSTFVFSLNAKQAA